MQYELFVGKRYLFSPFKDRSISVITWISICGVALGNIALITSTSVMNGFRDNLRMAITGALPHVSVFSWDDRLEDIQTQQQAIQQNKNVIATAPYVFKQTLLMSNQKQKGVLLRGIDPSQEPDVTSIASYIREEVYPSKPPEVEEQRQIANRVLDRLSFPKSRKKRQKSGIIIGAMLAQQLNAGIGSEVKLISSSERMTPVGMVPRVKKLEVIGIFESGISGYDEVLAFMDYRLVQKVFNLGDHVTGIGVKIVDPEIAPEVSKELQQVTQFLVSNWADDNRGIFQVMKLEKIALFLILTLIVVVAAFNIISSMVMLVMEKSGEIAILKSIGSTDRSIRKIFMIQGAIIGGIGTGIGVLVGLGICWFLMTFDVIEIPPGVYPGGNRVPVLINWMDVGITGISSFFICFLVTIYPATKAARVRPAEALRYE